MATSERFSADAIPRINAGVDVLGGHAREQILKPEPAWHGRPQHQPTILRGEGDLCASPQAHLFSQAAWNPHAKAVSPLLNLRAHIPSRGYTLTILLPHGIRRAPQIGPNDFTGGSSS